MSRGRRVAIGTGVILTAGLVYGVVAWYLPTREAVAIGAAMLAKQMCSCVYVAGRDVDDCRADQFPSSDPIRLEVLVGEDRVRAWVPAFGERNATYRDGFGCTLR